MDNGIAKYDFVVVGGGPVGLAAAAAAASRGMTTVVIEKYDFHGGHGSSAGSERQWRLQYAEADLAALTLSARTAWRDLEARVRRRLVHETGSLWFGDGRQHSSEGQIEAAVAVLDTLGLPYETVNSTALRTRFGFAALPSSYSGVHQPQGGVIDVAAARWALLEEARAAGCELRAGTEILDLTPDDSGVTLRTREGGYHAGHVIVTAGAWTAPLLSRVGVRLDLRIYELTKAYFRIRSSRDLPTWFAFQPPTAADANLFYGFGRLPWGTDDFVQVSPLFETDPLDDPAARTGRPRRHDLERVTAWVRDHMPDLDPTPLWPGTCLASLPGAHDRQFYLGGAAGLVPHGERIVVCAGGWAFKFVPVFGRACVELALTGRTEHGLERTGLTLENAT
ncbi:FAD-dependent oxidoreductase [Actinomadura monticuli]|uniref:FAD-dependent oxidoreductase n=1 Tax=Actinomadura monticuli TaxID=3097367 RepID=A0ABV4Q6S4_9ACTN